MLDEFPATCYMNLKHRLTEYKVNSLNLHGKSDGAQHGGPTNRYTAHTLSWLCCLCFRLLSSGSLRKLLAGWNDVCQLDERLERSQLEVLDLQHNHLTELPHNLFIKAQRWTHLFLPSFCSFLVCFFPSHVSVIYLVLNLYPLLETPPSLRYLNVSANKLENLPAASLSEDAFSSLQELYVTNNSLTDKCIPLLTGHGHLRVLHLAYNQLQTFTAR